MTLSTVPYAIAVDDEPATRIYAASILEDAGFRSLEAGTGKEALAVLLANADNVILLFTNVEMPGGMNGFELARLVAERWPEIEIVVASGHISPTPGDMPDKATFIAKPFSEQVVLEHLRNTLPDGKKPTPLKRAA